MFAQQTIPAFSDAGHALPMAPDAEMRLALDDVTLADLQCQPDNAAAAVSGSFLEWSMGNPTEFSGPAGTHGSGLHDSDLDDLPVRLVFEVGRVELSLGELQRLAPGALVPLGRPLEEPLDIMANGRRLGRGTLVQIGESLGVRIVSLAGNE